MTNDPALFIPLVTRVDWPVVTILVSCVVIWGFAIRGAVAVFGGR
jgi:hypothetical protein